jgi:hypothetical protein
MKKLDQYSDKELYAICKKWGGEALEARRRFAGLLPEVYKRRLYEKKGFSCIYEFAARLAGMSRDQVDVVLRLEQRFSDKPVLREALIEGKVSANKLAWVVSMATVENQNDIVEKAEVLSKASLDIFVKEFKNENVLQKPLIEHGSLPGQTLELADDVENELLELQEKGIDINEIIRTALSQRKAAIEQEKEFLANEVRTDAEERAVIGMPGKRHVPAKIRQLIIKEYGTKCAAPACRKQAAQIHHEAHWAASQRHDPATMKPLCKAHHEIAHADDPKIQRYRVAALAAEAP